MEEQNKDQEIQNSWKEMEGTHKRGKIMGGMLVVAVGSLYLAKELGAAIPAWLFTWKVLLIALGVVSAIKHKFRHAGWFFLIAIGSVFLLNDLYPEMNIKPFLWPVLIIMIGLAIMFKPRNRHWHHKARHIRMRHEWKRSCRQGYRYGHKHRHPYSASEPGDYFGTITGDQTTDDYIDSTACFAGVKKNVLTKDFKGGDITNVFGGTELNLMQADIAGTATLEVTQVFGGTKLIVPPHWEIKTETVAILGSVEDKRPVSPVLPGGEPAKVLILVGTTIFGGIEIRSY